MSQCSHDVVFYGNLNMIRESRLLGVVDIWKCRTCEALFVDEKRFTDEKPSTDVGLKEAEDGAKWAVLLCSNPQQLSWSLLSVKPGDTITHQCVSPEPPDVKASSDFSAISSDPNTVHKILLIEDHVNEAVEIDDLLNA